MAKKKIRASIDNWFDLNLDEETRTIYMGSVSSDYEGNESGVDTFMAESFIKGMHILDSTSSNPITIIMNNIGGDWYHGMAIFDAIQTSRSHCTILVYGHAMSMGSIILQAADHRVMMPNSRFMIHFGTDGKYSHSKIFEKWADEGKRINYDMENIYIQSLMKKDEDMGRNYIEGKLNEIMKVTRRFEMPSKQRDYVIDKTDQVESLRIIIKDMLNFDTILTPDQTIALGFADEIYAYYP